MSTLRKLIGSSVVRPFVLCAALAVIMQGAAAASLAVACSLSPDHDAGFSQMHDGQASDHQHHIMDRSKLQ